MKLAICLILFMTQYEILSAKEVQDSTYQKATSIETVKRVNFFISTKTKKIDPAILSSQVQAFFTSRFSKNKFYCIVVSSPEEMAEKVSKILRGQKAMIGNIWFDSHGYFGRRRSLFEIGNTEFSYSTIKDSAVTKQLRKLAAYCDTLTQVGIGSCYGGATYTLPAIEDIPESRMNGDSLMMALSLLLNKAMIYGSESFVMTKPGMFMGRYSLAGLPMKKKFVDSIYRPVWEQIGTWNCYEGSTATFHRVKTVSLDGRGTIKPVKKDYLSLKRNQKKKERKLGKLKRGNYNLAVLYRERSS